MDNAVAISAIGLAATMGGGVLWLAKFFANRLSKDLQAHTRASEEVKSASLKQAASNEATTKALNSFETYLRERNGRDNEMHSEQIEAMRQLNHGFKAFTQSATDRQEGILAEIRTIGAQHVKEQTVEHQTVEKSEVK